MSLGPDILLGDDGDLAFTGGDLRMVASVAQAVRVNLSFVRGEWFLAPEVGLPYYTEVLVKPALLQQIGALFRRAILETPGVRDILSLTVSFDGPTRVLTVRFAADTDEGEISEEVLL